MKDFKEFAESINELSNAEKDLLRKFTKKGEEITIEKTADNSRIRGGTSPSGVRDYKSAQSLITKGYIQLVKRHKDSSVDKLTIKLLKDPDTGLTDLEIKMYGQIEAFNSKGSNADPQDKYSFRRTTKKEKDAMERLSKLGYIKFSTLNPTITKPLK